MAMTASSELIHDRDRQSFWLWKKAVEQRTGVRITADRERALVSLLQQRMRELQYRDINQYFADSLDDARGAEEWSRLVDNLLIQETSFFRHQPSLDYVARWASSHMENHNPASPLWLWSLGCSSGEEAYSLAITLCEALGEPNGRPRFAIVATDISHRAIAEARLGVYQARRLSQVCPSLKDKYFDSVGPNRYRVKPFLRAHICFLTSNVLDYRPPLMRRKLNLIYCQNMLIYFRRWQRREIINQLTQQMKDDGHLIIGMGELGTWTPANLSRSVPRTVQAYSKKNIDIATAVSAATQADTGKSQQAIRRY